MVLIALNRPDRAQRVTVLAFTRNMAATSAGVSSLSASVWSFDIATPSLSSHAEHGVRDSDELIGHLAPEFRNSVPPPQNRRSPATRPARRALGISPSMSGIVRTECENSRR